jgi:hypothetical protein
MEDLVKCYESLLQQGAHRLQGHERRLFMAEVALKLCEGNARKAERRFGWGRETVNKGLHELKQGVRCLENFSLRRRPRTEEKNPQLARDIRAIVEPPTQADPNVKAVKQEIKPPDTLEISVDTKAKVDEGDYARGGKNPDGRGRHGSERMGS